MPPDEAPVDAGQAVDAPEAPDTGQAPGAEESFTDFKLDDLPEEVRPQVEALTKQWQGAYTQRRQADTQAVTEARQEAEQAQQILEGLQNPELAPLYLKQLGINPEDPAFLGALGLEMGEGDEDEYVDPSEVALSEVQQLRQYLAEQENQNLQQQQMAEVEGMIAEGIEQMEGDEPFDPDEIAIIRNYAETHPTTQGAPDVKGGVDLLRGIVSKKQQAWIESKKAPRGPGSGADAKRQVDLSNIKDPKELKRVRDKAVTEAIEQAEAAGE